MIDFTEILPKYKVVPVIAIEQTEAALPLADALLEGGLAIAEITFRTMAAVAVIRTLVEQRPELYVGAGTVLTADNVKAAIDSGAKFGVAPGLNPDTVKMAQQNDWTFMPGITTPTEIESGLALNCKVMKFFPAGLLGGAAALKAVSTPYAHTGVKFMPTGGVNELNLHDFLALPNVVACGGTWIATTQDIAEGNWKTITERCKKITGKC